MTEIRLPEGVHDLNPPRVRDFDASNGPCAPRDRGPAWVNKLMDGREAVRGRIDENLSRMMQPNCKNLNLQLVNNNKLS